MTEQLSFLVFLKFRSNCERAKTIYNEHAYFTLIETKTDKNYLHIDSLVHQEVPFHLLTDIHLTFHFLPLPWWGIERGRIFQCHRFYLSGAVNTLHWNHHQCSEIVDFGVYLKFQKKIFPSNFNCYILFQYKKVFFRILMFMVSETELPRISHLWVYIVKVFLCRFIVLVVNMICQKPFPYSAFSIVKILQLEKKTNEQKLKNYGKFQGKSCKVTNSKDDTLFWFFFQSNNFSYMAIIPPHTIHCGETQRKYL